MELDILLHMDVYIRVIAQITKIWNISNTLEDSLVFFPTFLHVWLLINLIIFPNPAKNAFATC